MFMYLHKYTMTVFETFTKTILVKVPLITNKCQCIGICDTVKGLIDMPNCIEKFDR